MLQVMQNLVHSMDSTRKCTAAQDGSWGSGFSTVIDVQGINYESHGDIDTFHSSFPNEPLMGTEEGSSEMVRGIYTNTSTYESAYGVDAAGYAKTAEQWWQYYTARIWAAGACNWTGFDYRGEPAPFSWPNISSQFGPLDICGFAKDTFYYYQANWTLKPVLHILPHWNWTTGQMINVWTYSSCSQVQLFLNGVSQGGMQANNVIGNLSWNIPYAAGTLQAIGYNFNGQAIITNTVTTTGTPAAITLQPDRQTILANGQDVSLVTVAVVDSQGRVVPTAANTVNFTITGGTILGLGNGDPIDHESDKATNNVGLRSVFNGLAEVIVQSTNTSGSITLTATSTGLASTNVTITEAATLPPPAAATGVAAVGSNAEVTVSWDIVPGATTYNVLRATTSGGPYTLIAGNVGGVGYADNGVINFTTYYYVITANGNGTSGNSAQVSATPSSPGSSQVINFDVPGGLSGGVNYSGQGALSDSGHNYWNAFVLNGTTAAGTNSDGATASQVTLTDTSPGSYNPGQGANGTPAGLEAPFADNSNNGSVVTNTLNHVPAGTYNLYLYGKNDDNGDANRGTTFKVSVGGTSYGTQSTVNSVTSSFTQGNDFVEFTNIVVGAGGVITFTYAANTAATATFNPQNEGDFNGLQLVPVSTVMNFDVPGGASGDVNYSGQGAYSDSGHNYWNAVVGNGTTSSGLLSDGTTASPITLTDTYGAGGGGLYTSDAQGANGTPSGLFAPFEDNKNSTFNTNTLNNVPAGTYSLYLYGNNGGASDSDRGTTFTVWTASTSASSLSTVNQQADANIFVKGVNYVVFTNLTLTSTGTINIKWTANTAATNIINPQTEGMFNGLQLVSAGGFGGAIQSRVITSLASLTIQSASGQGLTLQWPDNSGAKSKTSGAELSQQNLYYTPNLTPPVVWTLVTNLPTYSNGQWTLTLPPSTDSEGFYQLQ